MPLSTSLVIFTGLAAIAAFSGVSKSESPSAWPGMAVSRRFAAAEADENLVVEVNRHLFEEVIFPPWRQD